MDFALQRLLVIVLAMAFDLAFGDPHGFPHFVIGIGKVVTWGERFLRRRFSATKSAEKIAGACLVIFVCLLCFGISIVLKHGFACAHPYLGLAFEVFVAWQCLALHSLCKESMKVAHHFEVGDIPQARQALSMIVGRDTAALDEEGICRATVETIAENSSDGVIAPLLYLALGGAPLAVLYKAINTMDSMIAYKNKQYLYFGYSAAKLDDIANFVPARLTALLMIIVAPLIRLNGKNAFRIFRRDRFKHSSPNSAQSEAAAAGALGIQLGGSAYYAGKIVQKPSIGDATRRIVVGDIAKTNILLYATSLLCFAIIIMVWGLIVYL